MTVLAPSRLAGDVPYRTGLVWVPFDELAEVNLFQRFATPLLDALADPGRTDHLLSVW